MLENRTIFSCDNLPVMRGMESESVDLIYLDPPFNSNHNYAAPLESEAAGGAFKDTWTLSDIDEDWIGLIAEAYPALHSVIETAGKVGGDSNKAYMVYMAVRIMEMYRLLKPTGSLYLHCDSTMSHSIKLMLDSVFGKDRFTNEIIWKSTNSPKPQAKAFGFQNEIIYLYTKTNEFTFNKVYREHDETSLKPYRYDDNDGKGKYRLIEIEAQGLQRYKDRKEFKFLDKTAPYVYGLEKLNQWHKEGMIYRSKNGRYSKKQHLKDVKGILVSNIWVDKNVAPIQKDESTGYPTQKPLALLRRIIKTSSNEGDMVLDPFCGCATTCLAAEELKRDWIGIDIDPLAAKLVVDRMKKELGLFGLGIQNPNKAPPPVEKLSRNIKHILFHKQNGVCNGCNITYPIQIFHKDHIVPKAKGGADSDSNLQLLCGFCNSLKGDRSMDYLKTELKSKKIIE